MSWRREDHYATTLPKRGQIITITPPPEQRPNRRVTRLELEAHQQRRTLAVDAARERAALEAANEALEPLAQTWWARLSRGLRARRRCQCCNRLARIIGPRHADSTWGPCLVDARRCEVTP